MTHESETSPSNRPSGERQRRTWNDGSAKANVGHSQPSAHALERLVSLLGAAVDLPQKAKTHHWVRYRRQVKKGLFEKTWLRSDNGTMSHKVRIEKRYKQLTFILLLLGHWTTSIVEREDGGVQAWQIGHLFSSFSRQRQRSSYSYTSSTSSPRRYRTVDDVPENDLLLPQNQLFFGQWSPPPANSIMNKSNSTSSSSIWSSPRKPILQRSSHRMDTNFGVATADAATQHSSSTQQIRDPMRQRVAGTGGTTKNPMSSSSSNVVTTAAALRQKVLDEKYKLRDVKVELHVANVTVEQLIRHDVIELIAYRFYTQSKPGYRSRNDTAKLALAIEGGGIRGAVCAGMAAAIATLGLTDTFDTIHGSSAGSVIGAYMVSRQMCVDVYLDIIPAAKRLFVCMKRIAQSIVANAIDHVVSNVLLLPKSTTTKDHRVVSVPAVPKLGHRTPPGMNLSFVLDGIMDEAHGLRPLDMDSFRRNDVHQPLRITTSCVQNGTMSTQCFGTEHFYPDSRNAVRRADGSRHGIYACLEASMTVPGATGEPIELVVDSANEESSCTDEIRADLEGRHSASPQQQQPRRSYFDAFCFEPLPYRSAVAEGASHVLVLCSRPEGYQPKTIPGMYERGVANLYFRSHNEPEVASFFEQGGQQYIYAEDLLTLEEGKRAGIDRNSDHRTGVTVPPPQVLYGVASAADQENNGSAERSSWQRAHLLPLKVPIGSKELPALEQQRDAVGTALREGYAAAFDLLAPAIGIHLEEQNLTGLDVANLVFPPDGDDDNDMGLDEQHVLQHQLRVKGESIVAPTSSTMDDDDQPCSVPTIPMDNTGNTRISRPISRLGNVRSWFGVNISKRRPSQHHQHQPLRNSNDKTSRKRRQHAEHLLNVLPGFACGRMEHLASRLRMALVS